MKRIISVNYKFMDVSPRELAELVSDYVDGVEIYVNYHKEEEMKYFSELIPLLNEYGLSLQIHGRSSLSLPEQKDFLERMAKCAHFDATILVTFHPVYKEDKNESITETVQYLNEIMSFIDEQKINYRVLIENLNDWGGMHRLKASEVIPIARQLRGLGVTYDIGHVLADGENELIRPIGNSAELVKNIHVHTCRSETDDHLPIYEGDKNWDLLVEALANFNDNVPVVFEYNLLECRGDSVREKILDYLRSISVVSQAVKLAQE